MNLGYNKPLEAGPTIQYKLLHPKSVISDDIPMDSERCDGFDI